MLRIRLRRVGKKKQPAYRVVVADSRAPRDGAFIEAIGWYNPLTDPATITIDEPRARDWLSKGAVPSERVVRLLASKGIGEMPAYAPRPRKEPDGAAGAATSAGKEGAASAEAAPAPAGAAAPDDA